MVSPVCCLQSRGDIAYCSKTCGICGRRNVRRRSSRLLQTVCVRLGHCCGYARRFSVVPLHLLRLSQKNYFCTFSLDLTLPHLLPLLFIKDAVWADRHSVGRILAIDVRMFFQQAVNLSSWPLRVKSMHWLIFF